MRVDPLKLFPSGMSRLGADDVAESSGGKSFSDILGQALGDANKLQLDATQASNNLVTGKIQDVSEVVVATQKATMALQLTMQVRNKILDAYQEVMRMQV
jgi:flagellar hook-basal body complex protein FliE